MSVKKQPRGSDKLVARQRPRSARLETQNSKPAAPHTHLAPLIRRAGRDPRSLSPRSVLQLQSVLGNKATARLLSQTAQRQPTRTAENRTGLPDKLKTGVESLSGLSLDNVRVHYNSPEPARLQALAYTRGADIHVAPGQEGHLPHEAWHVVQQKQGRVRPTLQAKGASINDDRGLEREADAMGERALAGSPQARSAAQSQTAAGVGGGVLQRYKEKQSNFDGDADAVWAARKEIGITARSKMNHNVAVDYNDKENFHRSASNGHGELLVMSFFGARRKNKNTLNIVSERQPCGACEEDMRTFEKFSDPKLAITVDYFIQYKLGAGGDKLWDYYVAKGKAGKISSESDESSSESEGSAMSDSD